MTESMIYEEALKDLCEYLGESEGEIRTRISRWSVEARRRWYSKSRETQKSLEEFYRSFDEDNICFNLLKCAKGIFKPVFADVGTGDKLLDFGCGSAAWSFVLAKDYGAEVHLVDFKSRVYDFLRWRFERHGLCFNFSEPSAELPVDFFDKVVCWEVLEHILEPVETLKRITRALKIGGHIYLFVPGWDGRAVSHIEMAGKNWHKKEGDKFVRENYKKIGKNVLEKKGECNV